MRICFLMEPPRSATSVTHDVVEGLRASGAELDIVSERDRLVDLEAFRFNYDLYLFKSHSPMAESLAAVAHYSGGNLLNGYPGTMKVRDKILTCALLLKAGIPTPRTWVTDSLDALRPALAAGPIVVKPYRGRRGAGVTVCRSESDLEALAGQYGGGDGEEGGEDGTALGERLVFAQEYLEHEGLDYKAYAIGNYVHTIKRVFPATTKEEKLGTPVAEDPVLDDLVRRCGELFGLELYGVDLIRTPAGYSVIEVNCFPGFKGVPDGGNRIVGHILDRARSLGLT